MWHSKKFLLGTVLAAVVVLGSVGGVALAQTSDSNSSQPAAQATLLDRALAIYQEKTGVAIDQAVLKDAFAQAGSELRAEALKNRLQQLVDQGKLTQEQADQYQKWLESRPDVPGNFGNFGLRGHGGFYGMGGDVGLGQGACPRKVAGRASSSGSYSERGRISPSLRLRAISITFP